jgi:hypothetical protein
MEHVPTRTPNEDAEDRSDSETQQFYRIAIFNPTKLQREATQPSSKWVVVISIIRLIVIKVPEFWNTNIEEYIFL